MQIDCTVHPKYMEYFCTLSSKIKDGNDQSINAILKGMVVVGPPSYNRNGYMECEHENHVYKFEN